MQPADQSLVVILGDQLSLNLSSLKAASKSATTVLMAEVKAEGTYVRHHKKKLVLVLSAMRHFAIILRQQGWQVDYVELDDPANTQSLKGEIIRAVQRHAITHVLMTEPGEWRLRQDLSSVPGIAIEMLEDTRFVCSYAAFRQWASARRELRMEYFYRDMRRQTTLLMEGDEPAGGRWNYDVENRKPPSKSAVVFPLPLSVPPDDVTRHVMDLVKRCYPDHFGETASFSFAVTSADAEAAAQHFLHHALPHFGETQDVMLSGHRTLHHAVLSPYLNLGLLEPLPLCRAVEAEYRKGNVPLAAAEGFIRQVIGWREYVRGIYWLNGPAYADSNALDATLPLPGFYWTGNTSMNCVSHVIRQTREDAYAHHIQRLMITGNFALLAGIDPRAVHEWYLAVYADAFEWVELPNTIGMALYADGGQLASKPYAASGNYINRMSDYCKACTYDVKQRTGDKACPFNALYWDFVARHQQRFARNPRMAQICKSWDRFEDDEQQRIRHHAAEIRQALTPEY